MQQITYLAQHSILVKLGTKCLSRTNPIKFIEFFYSKTIVREGKWMEYQADDNIRPEERNAQYQPRDLVHSRSLTRAEFRSDIPQIPAQVRGDTLPGQGKCCYW